MQPRSGASWTAIAAVGVLVIAGGLLGLAAVAAVREIPTSDLDGARGQYEQMQCVEARMAAQVPANAPVRIASKAEMLADDAALSDLSAAYWYQRLTELAYPQFDLVSTDEDARYRVAVATTSPGDCRGIDVLVERL